MKYTKVIIGNNVKDSLVDHLVQKMYFEYVNDTPGITILAGKNIGSGQIQINHILLQ